MSNKYVSWVLYIRFRFLAKRLLSLFNFCAPSNLMFLRAVDWPTTKFRSWNVLFFSCNPIGHWSLAYSGSAVILLPSLPFYHRVGFRCDIFSTIRGLERRPWCYQLNTFWKTIIVIAYSTLQLANIPNLLATIKVFPHLVTTCLASTPQDSMWMLGYQDNECGSTFESKQSVFPGFLQDIYGQNWPETKKTIQCE